MRSIATLFLVVATTFPALAESQRILEPAKKMTTEQQVNAIVIKAYVNKGMCQYVRKQRGLFAPDFAYLVDESGKGDVAEFKLVAYPGGLVRLSQLLKPDDPSKCKVQGFVVDANTGKLDVGAYAGFDGTDELRRSDAYYFDPDKKMRMGTEFKLRWDIAFRRLMWRTSEIAAKCTG